MSKSQDPHGIFTKGDFITPNVMYAFEKWFPITFQETGNSRGFPSQLMQMNDTPWPCAVLVTRMIASK